MEIEALEAIFQQEFKLIKPSPGAQFEVRLLPTTETNHVILVMKVVFPPKYPDVAPQIELVPEKGLQPKHIRELTTIMNKSVADGLGEVMIFAVSESLKEWLVEHNQPEKDLHEQMMERNKVAESESEEEESDDYAAPAVELEEEEYTNPMGIKPETLVSMETFKWWKEKFDAEQALKKGEVKVEGTLSGRQLYQMNLVKEDVDGDGAKETKEGDQVFWFNESIYEDMGDDDLDLPSDEDDVKPKGQSGGPEEEDDDEGDYYDEGDEGDEDDELVAQISQKYQAPKEQKSQAKPQPVKLPTTTTQTKQPPTKSPSATTTPTSSQASKSVTSKPALPQTKTEPPKSTKSATEAKVLTKPEVKAPVKTTEIKSQPTQAKPSTQTTAARVNATPAPQIKSQQPPSKGQSFSVKDADDDSEDEDYVPPKAVKQTPASSSTQKAGATTAKPEQAKTGAKPAPATKAVTAPKTPTLLNDDEEDDDGEDLTPNMNRQQKQTPKAVQNIAKQQAKAEAKTAPPTSTTQPKPQEKKAQAPQQKPAAAQSKPQAKPTPTANPKGKVKVNSTITFG
jgi:hypothetical protein